MSDDLVKRLRDCEFMGMPDARLDYCTAHEAADRIEALEAANNRLNEQMAAIEEMGTESLNALPDCLMRLAPALVENGELKAKLAKAVDGLRQCEAEIDDYIRHEYPGDHPAQARYRKRDFDANPARTTLTELTGGKDE